jgi:hypothetical protein
MDRRYHILAVTLGGALLMAGCTNSHGTARSPSTVKAQPSIANGQPSLARSSPTAAPPGRLLVATSGTGPKSFSLPALATGTSKATIKLTCVGTGAAKVTDDLGGLVQQVDGCDGRAIYSASWSSTSKDKRLKLTLDASCHWQLAVWSDSKK